MEFTKHLFLILRDLKKKSILITNNRKNEDKPNATLKSVLNEALEIGLEVLKERESELKTLSFKIFQ